MLWKNKFLKQNYVIFIIFIASFFFIGFFFFSHKLKYIIYANKLSGQYRNYDVLIEKEGVMNFFTLKDGNDTMKFRIMAINNIKDWPTPLGISKIIFLREDGQLFELPGWGEGFQWWKVGDFNGNNELDIAVMYDNMGSGSYDSFYFYEWNGENFDVRLENKDLFNEDELADLDQDGIFEIRHTFRIDKFAFPWEDIYKWDESKDGFVLANHLFPANYKKWLIDHQSESADYTVPNGELLKEINTCLTKNAQNYVKGVFSNIEECKNYLGISFKALR